MQDHLDWHHMSQPGHQAHEQLSTGYLKPLHLTTHPTRTSARRQPPRPKNRSHPNSRPPDSILLFRLSSHRACRQARRESSAAAKTHTHPVALHPDAFVYRPRPSRRQHTPTSPLPTTRIAKEIAFSIPTPKKHHRARSLSRYRSRRHCAPALSPVPGPPSSRCEHYRAS